HLQSQKNVHGVVGVRPGSAQRRNESGAAAASWCVFYRNILKSELTHPNLNPLARKPGHSKSVHSQHGHSNSLASVTDRGDLVIY
ncbi:hypothetical protein BaRGS_00003972, partial [Batillaria attramentaria]